jgi:hypothetical protein
LLQREIEQGFAWDLYLISLGNDFRSRAGPASDGCSDPCTYPAASDRADDRSHG